MKRSGWFVVAALVAMLVGTLALYVTVGLAGEQATGDEVTIQVAQAPGGGGGGNRGNRPQMTPEELARMRDQMIERMLDQAGLNDEEKAAAKKTMQAKEQARQILIGQLDKLRAVANAENPSAQELQDALTDYRTVLTAYHKKIDAEDQALAAQLSVQAQVKCLALGILDNGLGGLGGLGGSYRRGGTRTPGGGPPPPPPAG
jgi:soluble cytochrome b562